MTRRAMGRRNQGFGLLGWLRRATGEGRPASAVNARRKSPEQFACQLWHEFVMNSSHSTPREWAMQVGRKRYGGREGTNSALDCAIPSVVASTCIGLVWICMYPSLTVKFVYCYWTSLLFAWLSLSL